MPLISAAYLTHMLFTFPPAVLERHRGDHARMAALAERPDRVAMHEDLALFHHEQIIRMLLDDRPEPESRCASAFDDVGRPA